MRVIYDTALKYLRQLVPPWRSRISAGISVTFAPFLMNNDIVSGSGEISKSLANVSIMCRLYIRMPEVGSVMS